jgi:Subtilase family
MMGLRRAGPETKYADAYVWAAGFDPNSAITGFPLPISPGADIITNSFGYSIGMPISGLMSDTFDFLTDNGRNGKGVLLFFSAGNADTDFTLQRPWAAYDRTFAIAASSLANDGATEVRSTYSNYGGTGIIDICAPSNDEFPTAHNPPANYAIITTTITGVGNLVGHTGGGLDYKNDFGGTSSATPLSAGIAALVLAANPSLNWIEVRNILRDTAVKIDSSNTDSIGRWLDINGNTSSNPSYRGPNYSRWYGFGRINAEKAVQAARDKLTIKQIQVTITTGDVNAAGTNGKVFLGMGGREFRLDKPGNQFERGDVDNFVIGDGSNVEYPNKNDLPMPDGTKDSPHMTYVDVLKFPKYIRFEPKNDPDNWNIDQVSVITIPETDTYSGPNPQGNIWLEKRSGLFLGLS